MKESVPSLFKTIDKPGVYGFKCKPHYGMGMVGLIVVGEPVNKTAAAACAGTFDFMPHIGRHDGLWYALGYNFAGVLMGSYPSSSRRLTASRGRMLGARPSGRRGIISPAGADRILSACPIPELAVFPRLILIGELGDQGMMALHVGNAEIVGLALLHVCPTDVEPTSDHAPVSLPRTRRKRTTRRYG